MYTLVLSCWFLKYPLCLLFQKNVKFARARIWTDFPTPPKVSGNLVTFMGLVDAKCLNSVSGSSVLNLGL
jgi:hypothetical protein